MKTLNIIIIGIFIVLAPLATAQNTNNNTVEVFKSSGEKSGSNSRSLRLSITVDNPEYLQVKEDDKINKGQVLADNINERARLNSQRKSILLQQENLKKKVISKPFEPKKADKTLPIPPASFLEEESNIAQAKLKLKQAEMRLDSRRGILKSDNPEKRASTERAEAGLKGVQEKVREQEELLKSMADMKLEIPIIRHEEAKLKALQTEVEQFQSAFQREQALMNAAGIQQQQELQNLEIAVQLAQSELQIAVSKLQTSKNNRELLKHQASISVAQRLEEENRTKQTYSQQLAQYEQQIREKEYQLSQLQIQLTNIEDKLAQIPILRSPRDGYIRRIKPWIGNNGKYTTTITISSNNSNKSNGTKSTGAQGTTGSEN